MKLGGEAVILIIIIIAAFFLAGGTFTGFDEVTFATPTPPAGGGGTTTPTPTAPNNGANPSPTNTPTPTGNSGNSIQYAFISCDRLSPTIGKATAKVTGITDGYISLEVPSGTAFQEISTFEFKKPEFDYEFFLYKEYGFSDKEWRIRLFSNGIKENGHWKNGTEVLSRNIAKTNCN